jgi:hypothetical protein
MSSSLKPGITVTASSLNWHRARNRKFADTQAPLVFRSEPNLQVDDCWYDYSLPAYEKLQSNLTSYIFMSTSLSPYFPLEWALNSGSEMRVLAIYRNTSSSGSAAYIWPVPTVMQSELTYSPGQFYFHLACRRQVVESTKQQSISVAFTLMYEATSGDGQRLSASEEAKIESALNRALDTYNTTCVPDFCLFHLYDTDYYNTVLPNVYECVDNKTGKAIRSARQHPDRILPQSSCDLVDDRSGVHFYALPYIEPSYLSCVVMLGIVFRSRFTDDVVCRRLPVGGDGWRQWRLGAIGRRVRVEPRADVLGHDNCQQHCVSLAALRFKSLRRPDACRDRPRAFGAVQFLVAWSHLLGNAVLFGQW